MIEFQPVTYERIGIVKEIVNSNQEYNMIAEGHPELTDEEILEMYESSKSRGTVLSFVVDGEHHVGIIDYLIENPSDKMPWLGLLMIHSDYQGQGYAVEALKRYERVMHDQGKKRVRLGVIKENDRAVNFWSNRGFALYEEKLGDK